MDEEELKECVCAIKKLRKADIITEDDYKIIITRIVSWQIKKSNEEVQ